MERRLAYTVRVTKDVNVKKVSTLDEHTYLLLQFRKCVPGASVIGIKDRNGS